MIKLLYLPILLLILNVYAYMSLYIHEFGHYLAAKMMGSKDTKIQLQFKTGNPTTKINFGRNLTKTEDIVITSAGVIVQLLLSFLLVLLDVHLLINIMVSIHLPSILFNLVPVKPLDGYYLVSAVKRKTGWTFIFFSLFIFSILISFPMTVMWMYQLMAPSKMLFLLFLIIPIYFLYRLLSRLWIYFKGGKNAKG